MAVEAEPQELGVADSVVDTAPAEVAQAEEVAPADGQPEPEPSNDSESDEPKSDEQPNEAAPEAEVSTGHAVGLLYRS
jgi:hypothetical protein